MSTVHNHVPLGLSGGGEPSLHSLMPSTSPVPSHWEEALRYVGNVFAAHGETISAEVTAVLAEEIPEAGGPDTGLGRLLGEMARSNIGNAVANMVQSVPTTQLHATSASIELARRLGERGVPAHRTVRVYQVGHRLLLRRVLEEFAVALPDDSDVVRGIAQLVDWNLAYLNTMSYAAVREHSSAQELWSRSSGAATAQQVAHVLADIDDSAEASDLLGYDVDQRHVALVLWAPTSQVSARALVRLTQPLRHLPGVRGLVAAPHDLSTVFCWVAVDGAWTQVLTRLSRAVRDGGDHARVACGEPASGLEGFRVTHRQALAARRVAELPGSRETRLTRYRDVAAASLLALHPQESGPWVTELLGDLAGPGEELARLRLTLRAYLEAGENASNAALRLYVHRNTVKYRVARALDMLPVPFEQNRLSIALALAYHDRAVPGQAPPPVSR